MTSVVDRMNDVRGSLDQRGDGLTAVDTLLHALQQGSAQVDTMRKKIVATKEGGMITGEERLRENLAELYGSVVGYEGLPSEMQVERTTAIGRELGDVTEGLREVDSDRAAQDQQDAGWTRTAEDRAR